MGEYDGLYVYFVKNFATNKLERQTARCKIIDQTEKSYRIKLIEAIYNRGYDEELWVRRKSVFRSYFNNKNLFCEIYNLIPAVESCKACLFNCLRRSDLIKQGYKNKKNE